MINCIYHATTQSQQKRRARDDTISLSLLQCKKGIYHKNTSRRKNHDQK